MSVYAIADLHGRYDLFQQVKDFIKPEDIVYVLGDCGDRGKDGWAIIKEVYENPQFIYIKGNHEDLLVEAMLGDKSLCFYNGGKATYHDWRYKNDPPRDMSWVRKLRDLPLKQVYINKNNQQIILCHAGYTPHKDLEPNTEDLLWDRDHFNQMWDMDFADTIVVHGHTPIPYMDEYLYPFKNFSNTVGVLFYCSDGDGYKHKCNIDCGAFFTGYTVLLDLDTFQQHIFKAEDCTL